MTVEMIKADNDTTVDSWHGIFRLIREDEIIPQIGVKVLNSSKREIWPTVATREELL